MSATICGPGAIPGLTEADAPGVSADTAAERLRAARQGLSDAAREASPEAAGALGGAALAISAHEAMIGAIEEVVPAPFGFGAQAALEASAMMWAALGAQAASLAGAAPDSGPSATEASATAALTQ